MRIKNHRDFFAGLMYLALGGGFAIGATNYNIGTGARMGPGYFPMMVGVLLAIIGAIVLIQGLAIEDEDGGKIGSIAWRPLFFIILSNFALGMCLGPPPVLGLPTLGLMIGIYAITIISAMAADTFKWKEVLVLATVLAVISYVGFIYLLKLQFPVWPSFITR